MAFDESLAAHLRVALSRRKNIEERKMFGVICFLLKQKHPHYFRLKNDEPFTFAGIWETWRSDEETLETCAIITTDANDVAKAVHNRMPVILTGDEALAWLYPAVEDAGNLLRPFDSKKMTCYEVDPMVGNVRNNSPDCIKPVEAA